MDAQEWIRTVESEKGSVRDLDIYPLLRAWIDRVSPRNILDIGSGQGICSEKIDLAGRDYTGLDPSQPFPDQSISREVLYLHTLDEIMASLRNAHLEAQETRTFRSTETSRGQEYFVLIQGRKLFSQP